MNIQRPAIAALASTLRNSVSESVTYRRGNDTIDGLLATPARSSPEDYSVDADISLSMLDRDWIVTVSDLAIAGQLTLPRRGDEIDWTDATGTLRTYLVCSRTKENSGRCYRHSDTTMQMYRIFSTQKNSNQE